MDISVKDLQEAISIRQQIDNLQRRLSSLLRGAPQRPTTPTAPTATGRYFSPATRAKLAAAARARWARRRGTGAAAPAKTPAKRKGQLTPAGRRKLSQLMKARWAARRKAGGKQKASSAEKGRAYTCRPKETFRANESALGSQKESRLEISNCGRYQHRAVAGRSKSRLHDKSNCSREDSNLHGLPHTVLSRTRLPVPPREQKSGVLQCEGGSVPAS